MTVKGTPAASLAIAPDRLQQAHARFLHDPSFQFAFADFQRPPTHPPAWLLALLNFLKALGGGIAALRYLFWLVLGVGAVIILVFLAREFILFRKPNRTPKTGHKLGPESWRPTAAKAKALLDDADRLAREGRFAEAAHVLLFRSIEDIQAHIPRLIVPSLTSRDIARLEALPAPAKSAFGLIAGHVEKSLFGGRPLDAGGFAECRSAYEAFAFPDTWAGRGRAA
jgi:hypothetical protein